MFKNGLILFLVSICFKIYPMDLSYNELFNAINDTYLETVEQSISKSKDINTKDNHGNTFLHDVSFSGNVELAKFLIEKGANVNIKNDQNQTPLHCAAKLGRLDIVELFLINKAEFNSVDKSGNTPLHLAANKGYYYITKLLLERGTNKNIKNYSQKTAADLARGQEIQDLINNFDLAKYRTRPLMEQVSEFITNNKDKFPSKNQLINILPEDILVNIDTPTKNIIDIPNSKPVYRPGNIPIANMSLVQFINFFCCR